METTIMRMNRRNVLVGLGTIVAGGGAALGTGAFSSVEADRDVTVETTGDGDAYVTLEAAAGADEYVSTPEDGVLAIEIDRLNQNATTRIDQLVEIDVNQDDVEIDDISVTSDEEDGWLEILDDDLGDISESDLPVTFGLEFDLEDEGEIDAEVTITIDVQAADPE